MRSLTCGVWVQRSGFIAVVVEDDGRPQPPVEVEQTDEGRLALLRNLDELVGLDWELVLPEWLGRDRLAFLALTHGCAVWLASDAIVAAVRMVGRLTTGPPRRTAASLARLPLAVPLRGHLRRLAPGDHRQLSLL